MPAASDSGVVCARASGAGDWRAQTLSPGVEARAPAALRVRLLNSSSSHLIVFQLAFPQRAGHNASLAAARHLWHSIQRGHERSVKS